MPPSIALPSKQPDIHVFILRVEAQSVGKTRPDPDEETGSSQENQEVLLLRKRKTTWMHSLEITETSSKQYQETAVNKIPQKKEGKTSSFHIGLWRLLHQLASSCSCFKWKTAPPPSLSIERSAGMAKNWSCWKFGGTPWNVWIQSPQANRIKMLSQNSLKISRVLCTVIKADDVVWMGWSSKTMACIEIYMIKFKQDDIVWFRDDTDCSTPLVYICFSY